MLLESSGVVAGKVGLSLVIKLTLFIRKGIGSIRGDGRGSADSRS